MRRTNDTPARGARDLEWFGDKVPAAQRNLIVVWPRFERFGNLTFGRDGFLCGINSSNWEMQLQTRAPFAVRSHDKFTRDARVRGSIAAMSPEKSADAESVSERRVGYADEAP
jgi:hypothetical protein